MRIMIFHHSTAHFSVHEYYILPLLDEGQRAAKIIAPNTLVVRQKYFVFRRIVCIHGARLAVVSAQMSCTHHHCVVCIACTRVSA